MRSHSLPASPAPAPTPGAARSDWRTLRKLAPYVWQWRWRVLIALSFLVAAKLANVGVPLVLKNLVDALDLKPGDPRSALVVPVVTPTPIAPPSRAISISTRGSSPTTQTCAVETLRRSATKCIA